MPPRIAIPLPHSSELEYSERSIPQYEHAVLAAGGEPVRIDLGLAPEAVIKIAESCEGVLLPGSKADIDPDKFDAQRSPYTAPADHRREAIDGLLLKHADETGKPVLGICYGLQSLNVYRGGSLIQHIPEFLPEATRNKVDHEAGRKVSVAHEVEIESGSELARMVDHQKIPVNSSHHQSAGKIGQGLKITAKCTADGIIEGLEGTDASHFMVAVQWHPERSVDEDETSRAIFRALIDAAANKEKKK